MKKFNFPLNTVLNYKEQLLDNLKSDHAQMVKAVMKKEIDIEALERTSAEYAKSYDQCKRQGALICEIKKYEMYLNYLQRELEKENQELQLLKKKEQVKRLEVIEAKKDTMSIEKLKTKKLKAYQKEEQKQEQLFIEEFVSNTRIAMLKE
ncbi:flagellar export protein FliJ [Lachnospiraceae bacterium LCP25S3_G4]